MSDTVAREPRSSGASPLVKLCRMLQSTLRKYPRAHLLNTQDAFGVSLDEHTFMQVSYGGVWTAEDMRDCLALFATWLVADPAPIMRRGAPLGGVLHTVQAELDLSNLRQDSHGTP